MWLSTIPGAIVTFATGFWARATMLCESVPLGRPVPGSPVPTPASAWAESGDV